MLFINVDDDGIQNKLSTRPLVLSILKQQLNCWAHFKCKIRLWMAEINNINEDGYNSKLLRWNEIFDSNNFFSFIFQNKT